MLSLLTRQTYSQPHRLQEIIKFTPIILNQNSSRAFSVTSNKNAQAPRMEQVEVDELDVQKKLGKINMDFVRKAEKRNKQRATMHRFFRRKDWMIAGTCFGIVVGIYSYTIFAIQQEKFLDDFEMPEEIDRTQKE